MSLTRSEEGGKECKGTVVVQKRGGRTCNCVVAPSPPFPFPFPFTFTPSRLTLPSFWYLRLSEKRQTILQLQRPSHNNKNRYRFATGEWKQGGGGIGVGWGRSFHPLRKRTPIWISHLKHIRAKCSRRELCHRDLKRGRGGFNASATAKATPEECKQNHPSNFYL